MAKGQKNSSREAKKPKKTKAVVVAPPGSLGAARTEKPLPTKGGR